MNFAFNDGGREAAGYRGDDGDCACRAVSIVTGRPYQEVYDALNALAVGERTGKRKRRKSSARTGVYKPPSESTSNQLGISGRLQWRSAKAARCISAPRSCPTENSSSR
jgi:hypothetical protein